LTVLRDWPSWMELCVSDQLNWKRKSNTYMVKGRNLTSGNGSLCAYWIRHLIVAQNRLDKRVILFILGLCIDELFSRPIDWYSVIWLKWIRNYVIYCDMIQNCKTIPKFYHFILNKIETLYISYCLSVVDIHLIILLITYIFVGI
jgi:hypothetical protein